MSNGSGSTTRGGHHHHHHHHHYHTPTNTNTNTNNNLLNTPGARLLQCNEPDADVDADAVPVPTTMVLHDSDYVMAHNSTHIIEPHQQAAPLSKVFGLSMPSVTAATSHVIPTSPLYISPSSLSQILPVSPSLSVDSWSPSLPLSLLVDDITTSSPSSSVSSLSITPAAVGVAAEVVTDTVTTVEPYVVDGAPTDAETTKAGRVKINSCNICHGQKVKCDGKRPCGRCVKNGRHATCQDRSRGDKPVRTGRRLAAHLIGTVKDPNNGSCDNPTIVNDTKQTLTTKIASTTKMSRAAPVAASSIPLVKVEDTAITARSTRNNKHGRVTDNASVASCDTNTTMSTALVSSSSSSSSSSSIRTASRSPARKKDKRSARHSDNGDNAVEEPLGISLPTDDGQLVPTYPSDIAKMLAYADPSSCSNSSLICRPGEIPADLALDGVFAIPFASSRDRLRAPPPSTEIAVKWVSQLMTAIPRSVILTFDETSVTRTAMANLGPWLKNTFTEEYTIREQDPNHWLKRLSVAAPIRVCPKCVSPLRQCTTCATPLKKGQTVEFADWLTSTFFAAMWLPKRVLYIPSLDIENLPLPTCFFTLDLGKRHDPVKLAAHHLKMVDFMFSLSIVQQFIATRGLSRGTPLSPTTASRSQPCHPNLIEQKHGSGQSTYVASPVQQSGAPIVTVFDDLFPVDEPGRSVSPTLTFSASHEIERLLGYSRQELALRTQAAGWKMNILFVKSDEATTLFQYMYGGIAGVVDESWSMIGHILTKWGTVIKCLVAGFTRHVDGYRTAIEMYVPLPHDYEPPAPTTPNTPITPVYASSV